MRYHDLGVLREVWTTDLDSPPRLALVHLSFRSVGVRQGIERKRFSTHAPALGLLNLAHSLRVTANDTASIPEMKYFDEEMYTGEQELVEAVTDWLGPHGRRVIAMSSYTSTLSSLESFLSGFDPAQYLLIVGGAHVTVSPDIHGAHLVVRGEGGAALRHILTELFTSKFGEGFDSAGICYCLDGREVIQKQVFDRSLEDLPSPGFAYDLLPPEHNDKRVYQTSITRMLGQNPQIYICTQSCRARCTFCSTYLIHGKTVARPVERIRDDLQSLLVNRGHDSIEFHDDDLLQHPEFPQLLALLRELGRPWFCFARVDTIDDDVAQAMADAGCRRVFLGVESMEQMKLDYFNKKTTVSMNRRAVEALSRASIGVVGAFLIGAPFDTVEDILQDLDAFLDLPLFGIAPSILSPDPGTIEFRRARRRREDLQPILGGATGLRVMPDVKQFGGHVPVGMPTVCEQIGKADLNQLYNLINAAFYFRSNIWYGLMAGRTNDQQVMIEDFYCFYRGKILELFDIGEGHPSILERADCLGQRLQTGFWNQVLGPTYKGC